MAKSETKSEKNQTTAGEQNSAQATTNKKATDGATKKSTQSGAAQSRATSTQSKTAPSGRNNKNKNSSSRSGQDNNNGQNNKNNHKKKLKIRKFEFSVNLNSFFSKGLIYLIMGLLFLPFLYSLFSGDKREQITISQLVRDVREEKVDKLQVAGAEIRVIYKDYSRKFARKEDGQQALSILESAGIDLATIDLEVEDVSMGQLFWELMISILPIALTIVFFLFIFRQARGGAGGGMWGIGKSKAKLFIKGKQDTKFKDVGGMDEAKQELEEVVDFLKHPRKYSKVGARTPKGVLLVGPSGTGKTLLARAVVGEAKVQFLSIAGSEFMEMLVGVGASRARDLFATAKKLAPSIIFIDEIDAIGRMRGHGLSGGHDEREQTLNQILVEMDGFTPNDNVIVIAATNRSDMLDPALVRPGRFDRRVVLRLPDLEERKYIIKIHVKGKPITKAVDMNKVARRTVGFSGADIENMLNEAAIAVARNHRTAMTMDDIEEASLKVKLGPSKKRLQDDYERKMTAYHEAGHAVVAHVLPHADPVHRISIVSRGHALGYTLTPPERNKLQTTRSELLDRIVVLLGGRVTEQMVFDEQTAGASNDIERATRIARAMVTELGMSKLGPMNFGHQYEKSDYSKAWGEPYKISDTLQEKVDAEINHIIKEAAQSASKLLKKYRKQLDKVSERLLAVETLDGDEFAKLMGMAKAKKK